MPVPDDEKNTWARPYEARGKDRRVHLAIKWGLIDGLEPEEIADKLADNNFKRVQPRTIVKYLREGPTEEVMEQYHKKHAHIREQVAEREESMWRRAREDERNAVKDEDVFALRPDEDKNTSDSTIRVPGWRVLADSEKPGWSSDDDLLVKFFDDDDFAIPPGELYYCCTLDYEPQYHKELVEVQREQPDRVGRQYARQEQTEHLRNKGEILGAYEKNINVEADVKETVELDPESAAVIREASKSYE